MKNKLLSGGKKLKFIEEISINNNGNIVCFIDGEGTVLLKEVLNRIIERINDKE